MKNFRWDKKYLYWGITAFSVVAVSILFFMLLQYWPGVKAVIVSILRILSPIIWGIVIAYLLCPLVNVTEKVLTGPLAARICKKTVGKRRAVSRSLAVILSIIVVMALVIALLCVVLPEVYRSIESIVVSLPGYVSRTILWVEAKLYSMPELEEFVTNSMGSISSYVTGWISNTLMPQVNNIIANVSTGVFSFVRGLINILIGLVASVYMLFNKENFSAQIKKTLYGILSVERVERILNATHFTDKAFTGFIFGKAIDSLIIGLLCYIGCALLRIPYETLVSVVVGITNIIPFFGPFIGAVPSALIILMVSPEKCLIFIIFILVLQQFDGNILGPKILGNTTGINGFWILVSILVGGGLFGFLGMICGVPVFAIIYAAIKSVIERRLAKRGLPKETEAFLGVNHIDSQTGEMVPLDPDKRKRKRPKSALDAAEKGAAAPDEEAPPDE